MHGAARTRTHDRRRPLGPAGRSLRDRGRSRTHRRTAGRRGRFQRPHRSAPHRLCRLRTGNRSGDRYGLDRTLHADRRRRPPHQPVDSRWANPRRHRDGDRSGALRAAQLRSRIGSGDGRNVHGIRGAALVPGTALRCRAARAPHRRQPVAREGRRGRRRHAGSGRDRQCALRCLARLRRRSHRNAGHAREDLARMQAARTQPPAHDRLAQPAGAR